MLDSRSMDDLERLLERCRADAVGRAAALIGRDGLVIETAGAVDDASLDLALAAAEATDLLAVADRLFADGLDERPAREVWIRADASALMMRRIGDDAFALLVLAADADPGAARGALDATESDLAAVLA